MIIGSTVGSIVVVVLSFVVVVVIFFMLLQRKYISKRGFHYELFYHNEYGLHIYTCVWL